MGGGGGNSGLNWKGAEKGWGGRGGGERETITISR